MCVLLYRQNLITSTSKAGGIRTLSSKWTLRLAWASLLVRKRKLILLIFNWLSVYLKMTNAFLYRKPFNF
jgi:hypothetical protein